MGFFSDLLGGVASVVLGPVAGGVIGTLAGSGQPLTAAGQTPILQTAIAQQQTALAAAGMVTNNGSLRKRTIVETFDPRTGAVVKRDAPLSGAPAVMQSDVAAANRLNRQLKRLNKAQPRKLVKESTQKQLKDQLIEDSLKNAIKAIDAPRGTDIVIQK